MKKRIPFGIWEPDSGAVTGLGRVTKVVNMVPVKGGFRPIRGSSEAERYFGAVGTTDVTGGNVVGAFSAINVYPGGPALSTLNPYVDYLATTTAIYGIEFFKIGATSPVVTGDAATSSIRDFAQYGGEVYLATGINVSGTSPICYIAVEGGLNFSAIGAGFQAQSVGVLRDFVVFGGTYDSSDGIRTTRVRWSAFGDGHNYTPSAATQSDFQDLPDWVGDIKRVVGGNEAFIVCENAVVLMQYTGGSTVMRFDITQNIGTTYGFSCVGAGGYLYMWSSSGFVRIGKSPGDIAYIGEGRANETYQKYLLDALVAKPGFQARGYHDEENSGIGWQISATDGSAMFYSYATDQWTTHGNSTDRAGATVVYASRFSRISGGYSAGIMGNLNTAAWVGSDNKMYSNSHRTQKAKFEIATGFEELTPGRKSIVDKVWPVEDVNGAAVTNPELVVTSIPKLNGVNLYAEPTATYSSTASLQTDGFFTVTGPGSYEGRYHRFQLENSDTASDRTGEQAILGLDVEYFERGNY